MSEAVTVKEAPKGNGKTKETPLIARNEVRLAEAIRNTWFAVLSPEQFADRLSGTLWTAKSQELRRYDQIFVLKKDETEAATLLVSDVEVGYVELVELQYTKLPEKRSITGPRIPVGYAPERDVRGYRMKRLSDNLLMTQHYSRLEDAVRALLDHANLRNVVR